MDMVIRNTVHVTSMDQNQTHVEIRCFWAKLLKHNVVHVSCTGFPRYSRVIPHITKRENNKEITGEYCVDIFP
jgi:hypothetical protein